MLMNNLVAVSDKPLSDSSRCRDSILPWNVFHYGNTYKYVGVPEFSVLQISSMALFWCVF